MFQLNLKNGAGKEWITGISVHLLGEGYNPTVYDTRDSNSTTGRIQEAIDTWEGTINPGDTGSLPGAIILAYPNDVGVDNPSGAHVENIIMSYPGAKIQGIGTYPRLVSCFYLVTSMCMVSDPFWSLCRFRTWAQWCVVAG
jgi:hypothetical protein